MPRHGWGIYLPNDGDPRVGDALDVVGSGCYTLLHHQAGNDRALARIRGAFPDALIQVRCYCPNWYALGAARWAQSCWDIMHGGAEPIVRYTRHFTWANEQNLAAESGGAIGAAQGRLASWSDYQVIAAWNEAFIAAYRALPDTAADVLHYPGLAYGHGEDWGYDGAHQPMPGFPLDAAGVPVPAYELLRPGIDRCPILNHHPYRQAGAPVLDEWRGVRRIEKTLALFPGKSVFAAETGTFEITHPQAPDWMVEIGYYLQGLDAVVGWTPFILASPDPGHAVNDWSRNPAVADAYRRTTRLTKLDRWIGWEPPPPPAPEEPPVPTLTELKALAQAAAVAHRLDWPLLDRQVATESSWNPRAVSRSGAKGLMQLMDATAAQLGVTDPFDPAQNVGGGCRFMRSLLDKYGQSYRKALAAYNWGPGNLDRLLATNPPDWQAVPPEQGGISLQAQEYLRRIDPPPEEPTVPDWYPSAIRRPITVNYTAGRGGRLPTVLVDHIADGLGSPWPWFNTDRGDRGSSAHFWVSKAGKVEQYRPLGDTCWANGPIAAPDLSNAAVKAIVDEGVNPNRVSVAIEHEGKPGDVFPAEQVAASRALHRWLSGVYRIALTRAHVLGHYQFDSVTRARCPGPTFPWQAVLGGETLPDSEATLRDQAYALGSQLAALGPKFQAVGCPQTAEYVRNQGQAIERTMVIQKGEEK